MIRNAEPRFGALLHSWHPTDSGSSFHKEDAHFLSPILCNVSLIFLL
jgi:hypothetical protein